MKAIPFVIVIFPRLKYSNINGLSIFIFKCFSFFTLRFISLFDTRLTNLLCSKITRNTLHTIQNALVHIKCICL